METFIPKYIKQESDERYGDKITHERYNELLNLNNTQGDYNTEVLNELFNGAGIPIPYIDEQLSKMGTDIQNNLALIKANSSRITNLAGAGRTTETVKENADTIQKIINGEISVDNSNMLSSAMLSRYAEATLQDDDDLIPSSKQAKVYIDAADTNLQNQLDNTYNRTEIDAFLDTKTPLLEYNTYVEEVRQELNGIQSGKLDKEIYTSDMDTLEQLLSEKAPYTALNQRLLPTDIVAGNSNITIEYVDGQNTVRIFGSGGGGGGTVNHDELAHRDYPDSHPTSAITGLDAALDKVVKYTGATGDGCLVRYSGTDQGVVRTTNTKINDSGTGTLDLWTADKITKELAKKAPLLYSEILYYNRTAVIPDGSLVLTHEAPTANTVIDRATGTPTTGTPILLGAFPISSLIPDALITLNSDNEFSTQLTVSSVSARSQLKFLVSVLFNDVVVGSGLVEGVNLDANVVKTIPITGNFLELSAPTQVHINQLKVNVYAVFASTTAYDFSLYNGPTRKSMFVIKSDTITISGNEVSLFGKTLNEQIGNPADLETVSKQVVGGMNEIITTFNSNITNILNIKQDKSTAWNLDTLVLSNTRPAANPTRDILWVDTSSFS